MTSKQTKLEVCLILIKQQGSCCGRYVNCDICPIGKIEGACSDVSAYREAVVWMKENHPDDLMELLI